MQVAELIITQVEFDGPSCGARNVGDDSDDPRGTVVRCSACGYRSIIAPNATLIFE